MPVASESILRILFAVFQYLLPFLAVVTVILIFFYLLSENRIRREKAAGLPGFGTIGELVVLSGSRNLDTNTWFPVPREGVLGAVRSCDLVRACMPSTSIFPGKTERVCLFIRGPDVKCLSTDIL